MPYKVPSKSLLLFGVGPLQHSIICRARQRGIRVIGIDPSPEAACRDAVDVFVRVDGQDFARTLDVARHYAVDGIITAATDKPLQMMARIASALSLPFFSEETAAWSCDKYAMKERFLAANLPCARGCLITSPDEIDGPFPLIIKPRDNSGSRGVQRCGDAESLRRAFSEARQFTARDSLLVEQYIEGPEYSVECLHGASDTQLIQITAKRCTPAPYAVEIGHVQPADLSADQEAAIRDLVDRIARALRFQHCASHTELKWTSSGPVIMETSPRLGGDYITSELVPLSTGISMEDALISLSLGEEIQLPSRRPAFAAIRYFAFPCGEVRSLGIDAEEILSWEGVAACHWDIRPGQQIMPMTNSLNRYGSFVVTASSRSELQERMERYHQQILSHVFIV